MTSLTSIAKQAEKFVSDNSPLILTAIGVTGTITTAILTGKASFKAADILSYEVDRRNLHVDEPLMTPRDAISLVWREFIPAIGVGTMTIACIICANRIGTRRTAAMAAAYSLSEKAFVEYKDKVVETIGKNKEQTVRDNVAQDRVRANPVGRNEVIVTGGGDVLCMDAYTGRYFESSMETIKKAQNDTNYQILHDGHASLNDFYGRIGLSHIPSGTELGWNSDKPFEIYYSTTISDDQRPCISIEFRMDPIRGYFRTH